MEEVRSDRSRVTSVDWSTYPIMRFSDVPKLDIELVDRPTEPPLGLVRARLRSVPFTPQRVKSALSGA
jgi:CO/xanthine dehydrogenase Mo-binding subunit